MQLVQVHLYYTQALCVQMHMYSKGKLIHEDHLYNCKLRELSQADSLSKIPPQVIFPLELVPCLWTVLTPTPLNVKLQQSFNLSPPQNTLSMFSGFWSTVNPKIPECFQLLPVTQSDIVIHISHIGSQVKPS